MNMKGCSARVPYAVISSPFFSLFSPLSNQTQTFHWKVLLLCKLFMQMRSHSSLAAANPRALSIKHSSSSNDICGHNLQEKNNDNNGQYSNDEHALSILLSFAFIISFSSYNPSLRLVFFV